MRTFARNLTLAMVITSVLACGSAYVSTGPFGPPEIQVSPNPMTVTVGGTIKMVANLSGDAVGQTVAWTTHNAAIATVDAESGIVTGVAPGTVAISAKATGGASGSSAVTVG